MSLHVEYFNMVTKLLKGAENWQKLFYVIVMKGTEPKVYDMEAFDKWRRLYWGRVVLAASKLKH